MIINSKFTPNYAQQLNSKPAATSFGKKYPYEDIMAIVSGSFHPNMERVDQTVADILGKKAGNIMERTCDYFKVKNQINKKYPDLKQHADKLYGALTSVNPNHFAISNDKLAEVLEKQSKKYGSKFIDIEI